MKNTKTTFTQYRRYFFAAVCFMALATSGCETDIPDTDTTKPEIRLTITGPGIGQQEMTNPPKRYWATPEGWQLFDLLPNTEYSFTLTVSDQGGVSFASYLMPREFIFTEIYPENAIERVQTLTRGLTLAGSRDDPRTGLIMGGKFRTPDIYSLSFEFKAYGKDFGGTSGQRNARYLSVNATVNGINREQ